MEEGIWSISDIFHDIFVFIVDLFTFTQIMCVHTITTYEHSNLISLHYLERSIWHKFQTDDPIPPASLGQPFTLYLQTIATTSEPNTTVCRHSLTVCVPCCVSFWHSIVADSSPLPYLCFQSYREIVFEPGPKTFAHHRPSSLPSYRTHFSTVWSPVGLLSWCCSQPQALFSMLQLYVNLTYAALKFRH